MYIELNWYENLNSPPFFLFRWLLFLNKLIFSLLYLHQHKHIFIYISILPTILFFLLEIFIFIYRKDKYVLIDPNYFSLNKTIWIPFRCIPTFTSFFTIPYTIFVESSELALWITLLLTFIIIMSESILSCAQTEVHDITRAFCVSQKIRLHYQNI